MCFTTLDFPSKKKKKKISPFLKKKKKSFKEKEFLTRKKDVFKENVSKIFFPF